MNITFLIGNGFDIGIGLHTSYEDFYPIYCQPNDDDSECIKRFKEVLRNRGSESANGGLGTVQDWSDFEIAIGRYTADFSIDQKEEFQEVFEDFCIRFNEYLENEEKNIDYANSRMISETMYNAIKQYYFLQPAEKARIQSTYNGHSHPYTVQFVNFNYTSCVDSCVQLLARQADKRYYSIGNVLHVHGSIAQGMIMGINDATQIANKAFAEDEDISAELIKTKQIETMQTNYNNDLARLIQTSDIICIYGMSIGETDKTYWEQIGQWLTKGATHKLVILVHDKKYNPRHPFSRKRIVDHYTYKFLRLAGMINQPENKIIDQIVIGLNHDIFAMSLRKEVNEVHESEDVLPTSAVPMP